ncbi:polysaccharide biosynthesis tyrosine autokinase [Paraburkholderia unamae]|uniref:Tyrosine-protein kinase Etk/Wzc n=1 Tax=Paraburkholderia unamae TaxID=219649 RepID=A0ABX5KG90_9BURK|nr:polysaccharide biosynthesis tyrosine autokinase [Paraburkholderia unamae]PVX77971.1 tyrosine-protein kinase Etk/Wzc [Paraburkholderia unamae]
MSPLKQSSADAKIESDEIDLTALLDVLVEHKLLIAVVTAVFMLLGALYAYLATPVYETNIVVQVEDSADSAAKSLIGNLSSMFDVKSTSDSEIQILGSRLVVSRAVDELGLYITARTVRFPFIGEWISRRAKSLSSPGFLGVGGYTWGTERIEVADFDLPSDLYDHQLKLTATGNGGYTLEGDSLTQIARGNVGTPLTISTSAGPGRLVVRKLFAEAGAAFVLERHSRLQTIDDVQKRLKIASAGKDSDVITASLQGRDPQLIAATLNEIGGQYLKQNADRKAAQAEQSLQFLSEQEPDMKRELEQAEDRFNQYRNEHGIIDIGQEAKVVLQQSADLENQLFTLRQKRQELLTRFGDEHPAVKAIDEQVNSTQTQVGRVSERIKALPLDEQGAVRLERDVRVNTDLYIALRNNMEQLRLIKAGKIGNVRIVDSAYVPEMPVKPKKLLVIAAATLLGLACGVGLAWLRDALFHGVSDPHTFETYTGLNVIATIPYSDAQAALARKIDGLDAKSAVLASVAPGDPAVESLRSLRTALQFSLLEAINNVVMISGATPGIGKSFISANLADLFAASGKRVLLIDADLRRGYLNQYLGVERERGLADVLLGKMTLAAATMRSVRPKLDFLATGEFQSNPSDLLENGRWSSLLEEATAQYDIVLVDAPPVLAVSDAEIMAPHAARVFLVARSGKTRVGEVDESVKRLDQVGTQVAGLLVNGMKPRGKFSYGGKYASYRYVSYGYEKRDKV